MPASQPRIYFDANVLLAYVGDEEGRADTVQTLLDEARRGEIDVVTSVLSIAEVAFGALERDHGLTEAGEAAIEKLWTPASPVQLIDVTQALTRHARALIREARSQGTGSKAPTPSISHQPSCSTARRSSPMRVKRAASAGSR